MKRAKRMADDYVKRSEVHKVFQPKYAPAINRTFAAMIDSIPAADVVEVRHAHWILHISDLYPADSTMECSSCNEEQSIGTSDSYCPNCGAKMDGRKEE